MTGKAKDDRTSRKVGALRKHLRPYQQAAVDFILSGKKPTFHPNAGKTTRSFDVMIDDEAFYTRTVLLKHTPSEAPSDPVAEAILIAGTPDLAPEPWEIASSSCKAGYGSGARPHPDGTAVNLTAKIVIARNIIVAAGDAQSSLEAAIDACPLEWPRDSAGWTFSSRRGLEAFDAEPIEIENTPVTPEPETSQPGIRM